MDGWMDGLNTTFPNQPEYCTCHSDTVSLYNTAHSTGEGYFVRGGNESLGCPISEPAPQGARNLKKLNYLATSYPGN